MHRMIWAVTAGLAFTGGPQQSDQAVRPFRSEVGVYRLQVRIVDKDGSDLSGLAPQDLELLVDGVPRPIIDLMEIDATTLEPANRIDEVGGVADTPADRLSVSTLAHHNATLPAARRRYMLFFDVSGGRIPSLTARAAAGEFVNDIAKAGDLIGVTSYSAYRGLHYSVPFTSDRRLIRAALDELAIDPAGAGQLGMTDPATLRGLIAEERLAAEEGAEDGRLLLVEQLQRIDTSVSAASLSDALEEMSDALADIQGRKHIVFFSTGFPNAAMWDSEVRAALMAVAQAARRAGVVFHSFHPGRLAGYNYHDVRNMTSGYPLPDERVRSPLNDAPYGRVGAPPGNDRDALYYLSGETGGTATFFKHSLRDGLEEMERQTRRYYTLAFPVYSADSEEVRIKIRPREPGVRVRWAPSRLLLKAPGRHSVGRQFQVANALEVGSDVTGLDLTAAVLPQPMRSGLGRFVTLMEVPHDQLISLLRSRDDDHLNFEVMGLAITPRGAIADRFRGQIRLANAAAELGTSDAPLRYQNLFALPTGEFIIKLLLRERELGLLTSRTFRVIVPVAAPREFAVSAPLAVVADGGTSIVQGAVLNRLPEHRRDLPLDNPFVVDGRLLSPRVGPLTLRGQPTDVFVTVQNFILHPFSGRHSLSVQSWIEDAAGRRHPLGVAAVASEHTSGQPVARFLLRVAPVGAAPPGRYRLVVQVTDDVAGSSTQSSAPVVVWN